MKKIVTVCPRSLDPINIVTYDIKLDKTSWTYSINTNLLMQDIE